MIKEIIQDGVKFAKIIKSWNWEDNLQFYTENEDFVQVATWNYNSWKHLKAHAHKICERSSNRTQEVLYIKQWEIESIIFDEDDKEIEKIILSEWDTMIIFNWWHSYNILEDNTQVLEIKNWPYPWLEKDKKVIEI
jgi:hypothetical protein